MVSSSVSTSSRGEKLLSVTLVPEDASSGLFVSIITSSEPAPWKTPINRPFFPLKAESSCEPLPSSLHLLVKWH